MKLVGHVARRVPRSLRFRVAVAVVVTVLAPFVFVSIGHGAESVIAWWMRGVAEDAVHDALVGPPSAVDVAAIARAHGVRLRRIEADGTVSGDVDGIGPENFVYHIGDALFGPRRVATLEDFELALAPLGSRPEIVQPGEVGCRSSTDLLVCHASARAADVVFYAQTRSRRAVRSLFDMRQQLAKLTFLVLVFGMLLAWWLGRSIVAPVERLRHTVLAQARDALPFGRIRTETPDELSDLAAAFNTLLDALAERARANQEFVADLAHEFKSPIAAIRSCAETLGHGSADPARLAELILRSSYDLDRLVGEFLELARAEAGLPNEAREAIDVAALVTAVVARLRAEPRFTAVAFELDAPPAAPLTVAALPVERALRNIFENAAEHALQGQGPPRVVVQVASTAAGVSVTTRDNGPGIPQSDLPRVFERFFTSRRGRGGTGLGLAFAQAAVRAHGGSVRADSSAEGGAVFEVDLPRA